jgi:hypothetical protein
VDTNGGVTAVTILRSMGRVMDVTAMKAFILWRANPGPARIIDVPWRVGRRRVYRPWR